MSRSKTSDGPDSTIPTRTIHEAYRDALEARANYQRASGGPLEQNAHEALQDAVSNYYEVLRPLLSGSNATEDLWERERLWPTEPIYVDVAACPSCGLQERVDELDDTVVELNELCPGCGNAVVERNRFPETDETGEVKYRYVEGLQSVDNIWNQREERVVERSDALGSYTTTVVETRLVAPFKLKTIARKLDEALKKLNLHAKAEDKLPTGQLENRP